MSAPGVATIAEVARAAGVSRATVSRVMNGRSTVREDLAERVRAAAAELQYVPSNVARSLSLGRTHTVALLVPDLGNPMFQQILRGANRAAAADGYRLLVADSIEEPAREAELAVEARRRCDALILCSPRMDEDELTRVLARTAPAVLVNRAPLDAEAPVLTVDYAGGIAALAEHLAAQGHRRFLYLAGPEHSASHAARLLGLRAFGRAHPEVEVTSVPCGAMIEDGYAARDAVLGSGATAVLAFNDLVAFGLLGTLNEAGVDVPGDISVAGFDDIEFSRYATPPLTTMAVPQADLGRQAWDQLFDLLMGGMPTPRMQYRPRLVERGSTGPAPRTTPAPPTAVAEARDDAAVTGLRWVRDDSGAALHSGAVEVARYVRRPAMPDVHSPRPYLHPVYTRGGAMLTETSPVDHRHHYGVSLAVASVNDVSFWGGRTFVRGVGPTLLENHGTQVGRDLALTGAGLTERVAWSGPDGSPVLEEDRTISAAAMDAVDGWALVWDSTLHATAGDLRIDSPATTGRPGAGYGGIFWRFPAGRVQVRVAEGPGEGIAHGSTSRWLAVSGTGRTGDWCALLVQGEEALPWFVRAREYPGVGPALAWDAPLEIPDGGSLRLSLGALLLDRVPEAEELDALADAVAGSGPGG